MKNSYLTLIVDFSVPGVKWVMFPSHLSKYSLGESHVITPCIFSSSFYSRELNSFGAVFSFKLVSPSKFIVSTNTIPDALSAFSSTISHGNSSSFRTLISSPARISLHFLYLKCPVLSKTSDILLFSSLSCLCRERSS